MICTPESVAIHVLADGSTVFLDLPDCLAPLARELGGRPDTGCSRCRRGAHPQRGLLARTRLARTGLENPREASLQDLWAAHDAALGGPVLALDGASLLGVKLEIARRLTRICSLCANDCRTLRRDDCRGVCGAGRSAHIARTMVHVGEEPCLAPCVSVFMSGCNWRCSYCPDPAWKDHRAGRAFDPEQLAEEISRMTAKDTRSLGFGGGNPDQHISFILQTLSLVAYDGPVVWNSNGYASADAIRLLQGIVDIYLTDMRYGNDTCARELSGVSRYLETITRNLRLADLQGDLIVRHLVLPGHFECCTLPVIEWLAEHFPRTPFSLLLEYQPPTELDPGSPLDRQLSADEVRRAVHVAMSYRLPLCPGTPTEGTCENYDIS